MLWAAVSVSIGLLRSLQKSVFNFRQMCNHIESLLFIKYDLCVQNTEDESGGTSTTHELEMH
jgi:hypothetical protein